MQAVFDSSTLISLAWSGQLSLLQHIPVDPLIIDSVYAETVTDGLDSGHPDAAAIESALQVTERRRDPASGTVDEMVVAAAQEVGVVVTNDAVIGRRAATVGARWLRTADLFILALANETIDRDVCRAAIEALYGTGRITEALRTAYLKEM